MKRMDENTFREFGKNSVKHGTVILFTETERARSAELKLIEYLKNAQAPHKTGCKQRLEDIGKRCDCGLDQLLAEYKSND